MRNAKRYNLTSATSLRPVTFPIRLVNGVFFVVVGKFSRKLLFNYSPLAFSVDNAHTYRYARSCSLFRYSRGYFRRFVVSIHFTYFVARLELVIIAVGRTVYVQIL